MFLRNTGVRLSSPPPIIKNRLFQAVLLYFMCFISIFICIVPYLFDLFFVLNPKKRTQKNIVYDIFNVITTVFYNIDFNCR